MSAKTLDLDAMFERRTIPEPNTGCLLWIGDYVTQGYGRVKVCGRRYLAHRLMYIHKIGPIPEGLHVLHKCDTPSCCNPAHLEVGTRSKNICDMFRRGRRVQKLKSHCPHGHELTPENTIIRRYAGATKTIEARVCRVCRSLEKARSYRRIKKKLGYKKRPYKTKYFDCA